MEIPSSQRWFGMPSGGVGERLRLGTCVPEPLRRVSSGFRQTGQCVGLGSSVFRGAPWGMSCTAIVSALVVPFLRSVCSSLPPPSMNPCPAV